MPSRPYSAPRRDRTPAPYRAWMLVLACSAGSTHAADGWRAAVTPLVVLLLWLVFGAACVAAGVYAAQRRQQQALREARADRQQLTQLVEGWLWQTDSQGRLTAWRPPAQASSADWSGADLLGRSLWDLCPHDTAALRARMQAESPLADLRVLLRAGGKAEPWRLRALPRTDADGHFLGYLGSAVPLAAAERLTADAALTERLWPAVDAVAVAFQCDDADGSDDSGAPRWRIIAMNPRAKDLFGDATELAGVLQRLPGHLGAHAAALTPGLHEAEDGWSLQVDAVTGLNSAAPPGRLLLLRPTADSDAAAPAAANAAAAEQESFAYSISHDLRAPIRVVEGFARIVKEDYGRFLDRIGNDHLDRVLSAAARMHSMIDALLALTRLSSQPLASKPVDLSQLANYIVEDFKREQPERRVRVTVEPGIVVQGDPTLLRMALENLLGNAWKYSAKTEEAQIEFRRDAAGPPLRLMVGDNGAGFDMRFADRLFGVFQRLHSANDFQGTGVGLASVRRIVRRHGGDIWAESEVGKGARFYFTLGS